MQLKAYLKKNLHFAGSFLNPNAEGKNQDNVKPTFTERPVIRQSDDGTKVFFECRLVGEPKPTVSWLVNLAIAVRNLLNFIIIAHVMIQVP